MGLSSINEGDDERVFLLEMDSKTFSYPTGLTVILIDFHNAENKTFLYLEIDQNTFYCNAVIVLYHFRRSVVFIHAQKFLISELFLLLKGT